jgi:riboflavin transporter FmnP
MAGPENGVTEERSEDFAESVPAVAATASAATTSTTTATKNKGNQTHWSARQLATMALFTALGLILSFIEIPLIPGNTITYDPANTPAMIGGLAYGPGAGAVIGTLVTLIHGVFKADFAGTLINLVAILFYVIPAALIYKRHKTTAGCIVGLIVGSIVGFAFTVPMNFVVWPIYAGMSFEDVVGFLPFLLPFNAVKVVLNSIISFVIFKSVGTFFK